MAQESLVTEHCWARVLALSYGSVPKLDSTASLWIFWDMAWIPPIQ